jgi:thiol:disulfide interchange protein DsbD
MKRQRDLKIEEADFRFIYLSFRLYVRFLIGLAPLVVALTLASAQSGEKIPNPVEWSLKVVNATATDGTMSAEITAKIEDGWHLYSLTPIDNGPRPTRITLTADQAFELAGEIEAPDPFVSVDPNFGVEVEYYEESVTFKLPLKRRAGRSGGKLLVEARYQTCTNQLCLPPKTVELEADVKQVWRE